MVLSPVRTALEARLFKSAWYFADAAKALNADVFPINPPKNHERESLVIGAILTSVAFLEATIDAVWDDLGNLNGEPQSWFKERANLAQIAQLGVPTILKLPLLSRFDLTLAVTKSPPLPTDRSPRQDVQSLILLRNTISHPKTQWELYETEDPSGGPQVVRNLERTLHGKFAEVKVARGRPSFFPDRCMSSACAVWAVSSVKAFATEFFDHLGVDTIATGVVRLSMESRLR